MVLLQQEVLVQGLSHAGGCLAELLLPGGWGGGVIVGHRSLAVLSIRPNLPGVPYEVLLTHLQK